MAKIELTSEEVFDLMLIASITEPSRDYPDRINSLIYKARSATVIVDRGTQSRRINVNELLITQSKEK